MDFDGDGRLALLSGSNCCDNFGFHIIRKTGRHAWEVRRRYGVAKSNLAGGFQIQHRSMVTAADWDGDGIPDLLWQTPHGIGVVRGPFPSDSELALKDEVAFAPRPTDAEGYVYDFAVADWDRDGKPDLFVRMQLAGGNGGIYWYRNVGERGLMALAPGELLLSDQQMASAVTSVRSGGTFGFCVGDWDSDGWPDLLLTRQDLVSRSGKDEWQASTWLYKRE